MKAVARGVFGRNKYSDQNLGTTLENLCRQATGKTLTTPDEDFNSKVVQAINSVSGSHVAEHVHLVLKGRLELKNPHKVWLSIHLIDRVLRDCAVSLDTVKQDILTEVAKVAAKPMNRSGDLQSQQRVKNAAFNLLRSYGREGQDVLRDVAGDMVGRVQFDQQPPQEGAQVVTPRGSGGRGHHGGGGGGGERRKWEEVKDAVQTNIAVAASQSEMIQDAALSQSAAGPGAELESSFLRDLVGQAIAFRGKFEALLAQLAVYDTEEANALMVSALEAMEMLNNALSLQEEVQTAKVEEAASPPVARRGPPPGLAPLSVPPTAGPPQGMAAQNTPQQQQAPRPSIMDDLLELQQALDASLSPAPTPPAHPHPHAMDPFFSSPSIAQQQQQQQQQQQHLSHASSNPTSPVGGPSPYASRGYGMQQAPPHGPPASAYPPPGSFAPPMQAPTPWGMAPGPGAPPARENPFGPPQGRPEPAFGQPQHSPFSAPLQQGGFPASADFGAPPPGPPPTMQLPQSYGTPPPAPRPPTAAATSGFGESAFGAPIPAPPPPSPGSLYPKIFDPSGSAPTSGAQPSSTMAPRTPDFGAAPVAPLGYPAYSTVNSISPAYAPESPSRPPSQLPSPIRMQQAPPSPGYTNMRPPPLQQPSSPSRNPFAPAGSAGGGGSGNLPPGLVLPSPVGTPAHTHARKPSSLPSPYAASTPTLASPYGSGNFGNQFQAGMSNGLTNGGGSMGSQPLSAGHAKDPEWDMFFANRLGSAGSADMVGAGTPAATPRPPPQPAAPAADAFDELLTRR